MKTKKLPFLALALVLFFTSCNLDTLVTQAEPFKKETFSGYVQKGPFINGSSVTILELDANLNQTGRSYSTTIADNSGSFEQKQIELISNYVELKADGYYFNEVSGKSSSGQITLYALADISQVNSANVNVITHLEKSRVEYLVQQKGLVFSAAKKQAQQEVLRIFNLELPTDSTSESLNLIDEGENNAILLAISCILQGQLSTADMSKLMADISSDIKMDGILDDASIGSALIDNAKLISLPLVRRQLETKYAELSLTNITISDFESKVEEFISKTTYTPLKIITYPEMGESGINILSDSITDINKWDRQASSANYYSMTANLPEGTSLKVILKGNKWYHRALPVPSNWSAGIYNESTQVQEFTINDSEKPNDIAMLFEEGIVTIEYYENGATTPTRVKQLVVGTPSSTYFFEYPYNGDYGDNILNESVDSIYSSQIYSLKAITSQNRKLRVILSEGTWEINDKNTLLNWMITDYDQNAKSQSFEVFHSNTASDLQIKFTSLGLVKIRYYEDYTSTLTRERDLWVF